MGLTNNNKEKICLGYYCTPVRKNDLVIKISIGKLKISHDFLTHTANKLIMKITRQWDRKDKKYTELSNKSHSWE